jgi:hypothetical protein
MKKILILFALSLISLIAVAQKDNTRLSNYEKYLLAKEKVDTVYNNDTIFVDNKPVVERPEYDDLYFIAKRDTLRIQSKELRLKKKQLRFEQNELYFDAIEQVQDVYSDLYFHPDYRIKLYFGFRPYYHYYSYWDPFYNPFIYDPWYAYSWGSPYFYGYPYWHGYNNWYYDWRWNWYSPRYHVNNYYNYYGYNTVGTQSMRLNKSNDVAYGRRERQSNLSSEWNKRQPVTVNRTIQVDRGSGKVVGQSVRSISNKKPVTQVRTITSKSTTTSPKEVPAYQNKRTYTPTYITPRMSTKPQYNNSTVQPRVSTNQQRYGYEHTTPINTQPKTQTRSSVSTQSRTYSAPSRSSNSSYNNSGTIRSSSSGSSYSGNSGGSRNSSSGNSSSGSYSSDGGGGRPSGGGSSSSGRR